MKKRQPHRDIPKDHFEEEQGQDGFYGPVSHLIKKQESTRWTRIEGDLKPRMFDLLPLQNQKHTWQRLLYNDNLNLYFYHESLQANQAFRSANGDLLFFCHKGRGVILTEYGLLNYHSGQYILIPKCFTYVFLPQEESSFFIIESLKSHFKAPDRGLLGRHALYSETSLIRPDLQALKEYLTQHKLEFKKILIHHQEQLTSFHYDTCIFDTETWQGDLFPYTLDIKDIMPVMSHRVHLPPSAHTSFCTNEFIICSFLPRPLEQDKEALKVPFYHQNTDYDEVLFYHAGDFFSRDNLHAGMMSLHPAGFPHGPHPKAQKNIKNKTSTQEQAVMIDSKQALKRDDYLKKLELLEYWQSWKK